MASLQERERDAGAVKEMAFACSQKGLYSVLKPQYNSGTADCEGEVIWYLNYDAAYATGGIDRWPGNGFSFFAGMQDWEQEHHLVTACCIAGLTGGAI